MVKKMGRVNFTDRERQLVRLIIKYKDYKATLKMVANDMYITEQAVKNMLYRLRQRYLEAMNFIDNYRKLRRNLAVPGRYL
jgi:hypothetical protein